MNAIHRLIGMGGDRLVPELLGHDSPEATAARPRRYKELMDEAQAFPAAAALLRKAHDSGLAVVLATSAPDDELKAALQVLRAGRAIDGQTTADDVESSKPSPEVFEKAMKTFSIDPGRPWPWVTASGTSRRPGRRASAASRWNRAGSASTN